MTPGREHRDRLVCHAPVESRHTLRSGIVELRPRDDRGVALRVVHTRAGVFVFPRGRTLPGGANDQAVFRLGYDWRTERYCPAPSL